MKKAIFLDRDGVINIDKNHVYKIEEFEFIDGVYKVLKFFQNMEYLIIVITNQSGIARGYYTEKDFNLLNNWMLEEFKKRGINITKVYYSPYHPIYGIGQYRKSTRCRKPNPGMILQAKDEFNIDLSKSILIGDQESDIQAGIKAGIKLNIFVKNGNRFNVKNTKPDYIINNIKDLILIMKGDAKWKILE
ncbi:HAD family hydrolase [Lutibacter sp. B2]|nr:HAD family hydrolase [Lutibacter sp. B2]